VWLRLLIDSVDLITVAAICAGVAAVIWGSVSKDVLLVLCLAVWYCYFVLLKACRLGTLGYRISRVRVVGFDGNGASLGALTLRFVFMAFGPLNYVFDILWLSTDTHRQALRDKFAHTYVVRKRAAPIGAGKLIYRYYHIFGYNFLFREIEPASVSAKQG
jgi:uncharacterized RDD family membrane protein YckC